VLGAEIDWNLLYHNNKPKRISLPTYPFARERYWILGDIQTSGLKPIKHNDSDPSVISEIADNHTDNRSYITDNEIREELVYSASDDIDLQTEMTDYLVKMIATAIKLDPEKLDPSNDYEYYGLDSLIIGQFNSDLQQHFGQLPASLFFTYI